MIEALPQASTGVSVIGRRVVLTGLRGTVAKRDRQKLLTKIESGRHWTYTPDPPAPINVAADMPGFQSVGLAAIQEAWYIPRMGNYRLERHRFGPADAARITGISTTQQRDWRRRGFLPATAEGWTDYGPDDLARMLLVRKLRDAEVSLPMAISMATPQNAARILQGAGNTVLYSHDGSPRWPAFLDKTSDRAIENRLVGGLGESLSQYEKIFSEPGGLGQLMGVPRFSNQDQRPSFVGYLLVWGPALAPVNVGSLDILTKFIDRNPDEHFGEPRDPERTQVLHVLDLQELGRLLMKRAGALATLEDAV